MGRTGQGKSRFLKFLLSSGPKSEERVSLWVTWPDPDDKPHGVPSSQNRIWEADLAGPASGEEAKAWGAEVHMEDPSSGVRPHSLLRGLLPLTLTHPPAQPSPALPKVPTSPPAKGCKDSK